MRYTANIVAITFIICLSASSSFASSLDELYRDIIRSDNQGYLPLFVKNRQSSDNLLINEQDFGSLQHIKPENVDNTSAPIKLSNTYGQSSVLAKARQQQWLRTIAAIKSNQVTPIELNDITSRVKENDPKATEILAWMYTKGVGVKTNFITAFNLYKKAASLNVANAEKNALLVYQSMNEEQRRQLKNAN